MEGKFSHYEILGRLGSGGMGEVYRAKDERLQREVALKILSPGFAEDRERRVRFLRESRLAASLSHPNIATVYEVDEEDGQLFFAMELIRGETLQKKVRAGGLPLHEFLDLAIPLAEGLAAAHEAGIIHRDLKPGNTMVDERGTVKILDFGLSRMESSGRDLTTALTASFQVMGTPQYMSPEQAQGQKVDARSDLFSMGTMLYELAGGSRPFSGRTHQELVDSISESEHPPIQRANPRIDERLAEIIDQLLAKKPEDRIQTAAGLAARLRQLRGSGAQKARRVGGAVSLAVILTLAAAWSLDVFASDRGAWIRERADEIEELAYLGEWEAAHALTRELADAVPADPVLEALWPLSSRRLSIDTDPPGADVFRREYSLSEGEWLHLGTTPITEAQVPWGLSRLRVELDGYRTREISHITSDSTDVKSRYVILDTAASLPDRMVRVAEWTPDRFYHPEPPDQIGEYLIAQYEVTNREYKEFVDEGGYSEPRYWVEPFVKDGRELSWEEALSEFTDSTGRPGPSTWEVGYPDGKADYPVTGVSWFEAAAYAEFVSEKTGTRVGLPTVFHWDHAINRWESAWILPLSNVYRTEGLAPVGQYRGTSHLGVSDMVGNAREWCYNKSGDQRFILGGGWNDPFYLAVNRRFVQPPFDRSDTNGFRLVTYVEDTGVEAAHVDIPEQFDRDVREEAPVEDRTFDVLRRFYDYDSDLVSNPLDAKVEAHQETEFWTRQKISFNPPTPGQRMVLYLYTPRTGTPPFQTVVYFPGAGALGTTSIDDFRTDYQDFILKDGRAFAFPVYLGTFERDPDNESTFIGRRHTLVYRDYVVRWAQELKRSVDYLETRTDLIDAERLAYFGVSWGGSLGSIMLAVEDRFRAAILNIAGFPSEPARDEVDELNFAPRVTVPVLMMSGKYDAIYPLESSAKPMFELLGTADEHKAHVISDTGHFLPRRELIAETLKWLDKYLDPVRKMD